MVAPKRRPGATGAGRTKGAAGAKAARRPPPTVAAVGFALFGSALSSADE